MKDRELRHKLVPHYLIGCKRILNSSSYYRGIANSKTELVTEAISRITRDGIVTVDGTGCASFREVDVIIYGTGFHATDSLHLCPD